MHVQIEQPVISHDLYSLLLPLPPAAGHTLSKRFCQYVSISLPAASIQVSTAFARSGRIDRTASSAFGDFASKCSSASYSTEAGCDDPGLKTASEESIISADRNVYVMGKRTWDFL